MTEAQDRPRRRRRRPRRPGAEPGETAGGQAAGDGTPSAPGGPPAAAARPESEPDASRRDEGGRRERAGRHDDTGRNESGRHHGRDAERGWRELAGSAPSQVGLGGALRARDVARPTAEDLAAAERTVVVVRRQWQPPEPEGPQPGSTPVCS